MKLCQVFGSDTSCCHNKRRRKNQTKASIVLLHISDLLKGNVEMLLMLAFDQTAVESGVFRVYHFTSGVVSELHLTQIVFQFV